MRREFQAISQKVILKKLSAYPLNTARKLSKALGGIYKFLILKSNLQK